MRKTRVEQAAQALADAEKARDEAKVAVQAAVVYAWDEGVGVTELSRQAGVTRATIYTWLEDTDR